MPAVRTIPREQLDELLDQSDLRPKGEKEAQQKVLEFLEECALEKEDGDVDVHLMQQSRGSGVVQAVCTFKVRAGEDLAGVAQQIVDEAARDARDGACLGKVRYAVSASGRRGRRIFTLAMAEPPDADVSLEDVELLSSSNKQQLLRIVATQARTIEVQARTIRALLGRKR